MAAKVNFFLNIVSPWFMRHYAAVVVVVRGEDWGPIVTGVWQQSNNCVNSQSL
jgi:hypothetical protein